MTDDYWNHNTHYHRLILDAIPNGAKSALDIGCGNGLLARKLATRIDTVVGIDTSPEMIQLARAANGDAPTPIFAEASFLDGTTTDSADRLLAPGKYDFITAVAVIHHVDLTEALTAVRTLLAPGGRVVVIGLANDVSPLGLAYEFVNVPAHRVLSRKHGGTFHVPGMPIKDPVTRTSEVRRTARRLLPGSNFRRRILWRYSLIWDKPGTVRSL